MSVATDGAGESCREPGRHASDWDRERANQVAGGGSLDPDISRPLGHLAQGNQGKGKQHSEAEHLFWKESAKSREDMMPFSQTPGTRHKPTDSEGSFRRGASRLCCQEPTSFIVAIPQRSWRLQRKAPQSTDFIVVILSHLQLEGYEDSVLVK